jgi:signal transduction histidine kinase
MNQFFNQVFTILTTPPGNLVYYLLLTMSIAGSLQGTIALLRSGAFPNARRAIIGLVILLTLQIITFMLSPLAWLEIIDPQVVMPPADRAFTLLGLIWIAWIWIFPKPAPKADVATVVLSLLTIFLLGISITFWIQNPSASGFNHSFQDNLWQIFSLAFIVLALLILLIRRPNGYGYGLGALLLAGVGHLGYLLITGSTGNFSGLIRLSQIAMYPILLAIPQCFSASLTPTPLLVETNEEGQSFQERRRFSTDPKTFHSLLTLAAESDTNRVGPNITHSIALSMLADLCFLILIDADSNLNIACGYDLIREEVLEGKVIAKDSIPLLSNAILRGRPLRLPASNNSADIQGLGQIIGLSNPGNAMSIPIESSARGSAVGAILLLSPYSNRVWSADDQSYLTNVSGSIVPIMARGQRLTAMRRERDAALKQVSDLQDKIQVLNTNIQTEQELAGKNQLMVENMAALSAALDEAQKEIAQLKADNEALRTAPDEKGASTKSDTIEQQFRMTLEELAYLQNELGDANSRIFNLEQQPGLSSIPDDQVKVIASISQELRQPMSSIIGYTDILLSESVGILGALQRKFLERVKTSTERIDGLVDDLIQITSVENGRMLIKSEIIDMNHIIDIAVAYTSPQLREKKITMRLDIPESPPKIHIDGEAFQQILIHLLQNAGAATLVEGTVMLRVKIQEEDGKDYLLIKVMDSGGGIPSEDVPKFLARRYRADNAPIQGLGDTGVGLSIAKILAEAQSGRIWVETSLGVGSTISVLLPIETVKSEEED